MPLQLSKLRESRNELPTGVQYIIEDAFHATDEVHQFVRLVSAFEYLIKLVSTSIHGAVLESNPGSWYEERVLRRHFIEKDPSLGDWIHTAHTLRKRVSGNPLVSAVIDDVWENRPSEIRSGETSATWKMCRVIGASRTFLTETQRSKSFSIYTAFTLVTNLRNAYAHGALTGRFAGRYGQPVADALAEVARNLSLYGRWSFVIPLHFDTNGRDKAVVLKCDDFGRSNGVCDPHSVDIGERSLKWGKLYLTSNPVTSLESAILLEPLLRFEQSHRDFQFFNRFNAGDLTAEYLSYRSGDFDFDPSFSFGPIGDKVDEVEEDAEDIIELEASADATVVTSVHRDESFLQRLKLIITDGVSESTLKRCRSRFREELDSLETSEQRSLFNTLRSHFRDNGSSESHRVIGGLTREFGFYDIASEELAEAEKYKPEDCFIKQSLGHSLLQYGSAEKQGGKMADDQNRFRKGRELINESKRPLEASLRDDPTSPEEVRHNIRSLSMLVDAHCRLAEFDYAMNRCSQGLRLDPNNQRLLDQQEFLHGVTDAASMVES